MERDNKAREKSQRRKTREVKWIAMDACEREWKAIKIKHDQGVEAWKVKCGILKAAGTRPKDLPIKPKRPSRPKPVVEDEEDEEDDESDQGD